MLRLHKSNPESVSLKRACLRLAPAAAAAALAFAMGLASCSNKQAQTAPPGPPAFPVSVARAVTRTVPVQLEAIGRVEALASVSIKSQINGQVTEVHFVEGQDVKKGELLFSLDRRALESVLQQAEANLARDTAAYEKAKSDAARYDKLFQEGVVARELRDTYVTSAEWHDSVLRGDRAAIESARVQLSYTHIYAPISGRAGSRMIHPGDIVKANDNPVLVVIHQMQPIYVSFSVPEQNLARIKEHMRRGRLTAQAASPGDAGAPVAGALTFVDNTVDQETGTIRMKATFPNDDRRLWPGQFVHVTLTLAERPNAVLVPSQAVMSGQAGQMVFVVREDMTAEARPVETGQSFGGEMVIEKGVSAGERVVTDGQLRLAPNAKVSIKDKL